jgi:hypothetical protein
MQKILETGMLNKDIYNRGLIHRVTGKLQKRAIILNIPPNVLSVTKGKDAVQKFCPVTDGAVQVKNLKLPYIHTVTEQLSKRMVGVMS